MRSWSESLDVSRESPIPKADSLSDESTVRCRERVAREGNDNGLLGGVVASMNEFGARMRVIEVMSPGLLTTVQDLGRPGYGALGVSASGAADAVSLRIGNRLVGNAEGVAALEMTLLGGTFRFPEGAVAALAGSDFGATLADEPVAIWSSFEVKAGATLHIGATRSGARCYLCVRGGIAVSSFLGSASTHLLSGLGGHEGRGLRKGDVLRIGELSSVNGSAQKKTIPQGLKPPDAESGNVGAKAPTPKAQSREFAIQIAGPVRAMVLPAMSVKKLAPRKRLRVTPGPQHEWFSRAVRKAFCENTYRVSEESNRMGLRLEGEPLPEANHGEMVSEGVALGAVQIAAGGKPIILFVEQQTSGGYAKIANVISADLHSVGQLRPRDEVSFEWVDFANAQRALVEQEDLIRRLQLTVDSQQPARTRLPRKHRGTETSKK